MLRTRLVWFTVGFSVSAAAISQFVWRDLLSQRYALSSHTNQKFEDLEARVLNLESISPKISNQTTQHDISINHAVILGSLATSLITIIAMWVVWFEKRDLFSRNGVITHALPIALWNRVDFRPPYVAGLGLVKYYERQNPTAAKHSFVGGTGFPVIMRESV
ncbi:unnamed protein product [Dovyalis caffra]|uniref:Uncharacterized protein n=1 Tax=Dovyalis caffra TaxID=77055 RepID=A0AAV1SD50_9ROSI|nr:unnamed protein product [Dovyalis caffra]